MEPAGGWLLRLSIEMQAASDLQGGLLPVGGEMRRRERHEATAEWSRPVGDYLFMFVDGICLDRQFSSRSPPGRAQGVLDRSVSEAPHARFSGGAGESKRVRPTRRRKYR